MNTLHSMMSWRHDLVLIDVVTWLSPRAPAGPPEPGPALALVTHAPRCKLALLLRSLLPLQLDTHSTLLFRFITRILHTGLPGNSLALMSRLSFSLCPLDNITSHHINSWAPLLGAGSGYHKIRDLNSFSILLETLLNFFHFAFGVVLLDCFIIHCV